jgi:O-antigen/teichoic acid export membrane protein
VAYPSDIALILAELVRLLGSLRCRALIGRVRKLSQIIGLKIKNGYFLSRGLSSLLAFIFSLYYSKELGIEKRSLVTFILVVVVLVIIAFTSGIGLAFRKYTSSSPGLISLSAYLYANIILAFLVSLCTSAILLLYSLQYNSIPPTLFFLTLIYSFLGSLDFNYHQGLIAFRNVQNCFHT